LNGLFFDEGTIMAITVNGVELTDEQISAELPRHQDSQTPLQSATRELILRELIRQKAAELGLTAATEDATIGAVLQNQTLPPVVTEEECVHFYENNPDAFVREESVDASHILLHASETIPAESVRDKAQEILSQAIAKPETFAELAKQYSQCPSCEMGGNLGPATKGILVAEFEHALFGLEENTICPELVETRFGLHIVQAGRKTPSSRVSFEEAKDRIAEYLNTAAQQRVLHQYLRTLVATADIQGFDMT
jgi:peptidyl-prolyl cis-trans isomerase C